MNAKELLDRYNVEHDIAVRSLPVLPLGYWDGEIHQYITKEEKRPYLSKKLYILETNTLITVDEDVDPRGGVMSRFDTQSHVTTPEAP